MIATIRRALHPPGLGTTDVPSEAARGKVLVVDDVAINLAITHRQLAKLGVASDVVDDPLKALEMLKSGAYLLALIDIGMPGMSGLELTRQLREAEKKTGSHTPVVALTASYGSEEDIARYRRAGMDGQLTKPVVLKELTSILHRWLSDDAAPDQQTTEQSVPEASAESDLPPIDIDEFKEILGTDDHDLIKEMFDLFVTMMPDELENLTKAVTARDPSQSREAAHRFKSASRNAAARRLSDLLEKMEHNAPAADWEVMDGDLAQVREECAKVADYMRADNLA